MISIHLRTVREKLLLMVLVANFFTLIAAGSTLLYHDLLENRTRTANELTALADILGQGSTAALEFDDAKVANENLAQLRANPNIVAAAIYTSKGILFAQYILDNGAGNSLPSKSEVDGFRFETGELSVFRSIATKQGRVGAVYLKERYELSKWLLDYLVILAAVLVASLILGLVISSRLQRWISGPIGAVSTIARQVMEQRNYHLRATKSTEDEVGQLADAFNGMLQTLEHEISERSTAEQAVRTLNAQLEQRVIDRTAELQVANQALVSRTEEAETANRAKADFLANMSHEIRTPMNAILGLAYLLDQSHLDGDASDLVKKIRNAGRSLQSIINDILDFSKIEAGRLDIEHAPFRIADVLDNLAGIMSANAGDKELELVISPPPQVGGQLLGDALRLEQVLINLTGNAIKFTDQGSVVVGISLLSRDEKIAKLRFSIKDSGIGIPLEKQTQIFAAFAQADVSTTRRFGGTGLGLTICRHLVTKMGGEIGVISEVGRGSEFWFTIPFEWSAVTDYQPPEMATLDVLIVDDSEIARENLSLTAQSVGWNPIKAESGEVAIQKIHSKNASGAFNVLLVDWKMPGMNGLELATRVRETFKDASAPIVLMVTAFSRDELLKQPDIEFIDGILNKPVTSSGLYNSVAEALRRKNRGSIASLNPSTELKSKRIPGVRVLVVDDSEINREVAMRILKTEGAIVTTVNDGKAAVDWLRTNPGAVDVVLMDVQMPVMDGYEATRHLRTMPDLVNLPVIALTAGAFKAQQEAARDAGMNAFVAKPFNVEELVASIQTLTRRHPEPSQKATDKEKPYVPTVRAASAENLPGIDVNKGLSVWNDPAVYGKFLMKFSSEYADSRKMLTDFYAKKDYESAGAFLHKLKGAAGNLALVDVALHAAELETISPEGDYSNLLSQLDAALATVFSSIAVFATKKVESEQQPLKIVDQEQTVFLLSELLRSLDMDNPDRANQLFDDLLFVFPLDTLAPLRASVDDFNFREAEIQVRQLASQLGIELKE